MNADNDRILIHATNIQGIGAIQVANSLLGELVNILYPKEVTIYGSNMESFREIGFYDRRPSIIPYHRTLPNSISRAWECMVNHKKYNGFRKILVLGDLPLNNPSRQTVLVHQPHLISPKVNPYCSREAKYIIARRIFRHNLKYADMVIVQTGSMGRQLMTTYPELRDRMAIIPQPAPAWLLDRRFSQERKYDGLLRLFYPAAGYLHKNHRLLAGMAAAGEFRETQIAKLVVTLDDLEEKRLLPRIPWVENVGRISAKQCLDQYSRTDALFFPSLLESYGLPLVEAMTLGLPILCADLPYARWLCEGAGIYFAPTDPVSAWQAVRELRQRLNNGWHPDWREALKKLPPSWNDVAKQVVAIMGLA